MAVNAFESVKDQMGFCGIWCGSCAAGNGAMQELTRRYEELVKKYNLEKWAPKNFDFREFAKGLTSLQTMPLCVGCQKGGGPPTCKIRICALGKGVGNCSQCNQLIQCTNFEQVEKTHPRIKQDLMKMKNEDKRQITEKWLGELKAKWPHCILFCTQ